MTNLANNLIAIGEAYIEISTQFGKPMPSIEEVRTQLEFAIPAEARYYETHPHMVTAIQRLKERYY